MKPFSRFRFYHWVLALVFAAAYLTGEDAELAHVWLGYGLLLLLGLRLLLALFNARGFPRLWPSGPAWRKPVGALGRMVTLSALLGFAATLGLGLTLVDNRAALSDGVAKLIPAAQADTGGDFSPRTLSRWLNESDEIHEALANAALALVGGHLAWLLLFNRRQAWALVRGSAPAQASAAPAFRPQSVPPQPAAPALMSLQVLAVQHDIRAQACHIRLRRPTQADKATFLPGQFLTVAVPVASAPVWRCYSLSSAPHDADWQLTVKRVAGGQASNWLNDQLKAGDCLHVRAPAGQFVAPSLAHDLLLIAAGSGITPVYSILRAALHDGQARVRLIYANRQADAVIFAREIAQLQRDYPQRLSVHWHLDTQDGRLDGLALLPRVQGWTHANAMLCGPQALMAELARTLLSAGMPASRIHQERFEPAQAIAPTPGQTSTALQVTLDGHTHQLPVAAGEVLLTAMERHGLRPPSACRSGACAACKCRVTSGEVHLRENGALTNAELAEGWTLACQAEAVSPRVTLQY